MMTALWSPPMPSPATVQRTWRWFQRPFAHYTPVTDGRFEAITGVNIGQETMWLGERPTPRQRTRERHVLVRPPGGSLWAAQANLSPWGGEYERVREDAHHAEARAFIVRRRERYHDRPWVIGFDRVVLVYYWLSERITRREASEAAASADALARQMLVEFARLDPPVIEEA